MFTRIAHVCLMAKELRRSIVYYSKLGFTVRFKFTRKGAEFGVYLQISPRSYIEIFENPDLGPVVNNGIAHFCLETDAMEQLREKLTAAGIPFTPEKTGCDHTRQIWLTDPDGNKFEVHQYTEKSMQLGGADTVEADW